jgi:FMN phosphatase YigB (HAD superfamily)
MRKYDTVMFDVGGTLIGPIAPDPYIRFFSAHDVPVDMVSVDFCHDVLRRHSQLWLQHRASGGDPDIDGYLWLAAFQAALGPFRALAKPMLEWFLDGKLDALYDDVVPALDWLKARSYRLGILSNFRSQLGERLEGLGICRYFDFLTVSEIEGIKKPALRVFEIATERAGVPASRILYVGDNPETDIHGALAANLHVALIDREGNFRDVACPRIEKLTDLCAVLGVEGTE